MIDESMIGTSIAHVVSEIVHCNVDLYQQDHDISFSPRKTFVD